MSDDVAWPAALEGAAWVPRAIVTEVDAAGEEGGVAAWSFGTERGALVGLEAPWKDAGVERAVLDRATGTTGWGTDVRDWLSAEATETVTRRHESWRWLVDGRLLVWRHVPTGQAARDWSTRQWEDLLVTPVGGVQWHGEDVLLGYDLAATQRLVGLQELEASDLAALGRLLGRLGARAGGVMAAPPEQKPWNARLKALEEASRPGTLWRSPYHPTQHATLTHGAVDEAHLVKVADGEWRLLVTGDDPLVPWSASVTAYPAHRDAAQLLRLAAMAAAANGADADRWRQMAFGGWASEAPAPWTRRAPLDAMHGGLAVWEYETALADHMAAFAWGEPTKPVTETVIASIRPIQARLFNAKGAHVGMLIAATLAIWFTAFGLPNGDGGLARTLTVGGFAVAAVCMRWLSLRLRPPWRP